MSIPSPTNSATALPNHVDPERLLAAWPRDQRLAMLASHGGGPFGRFTFAASPVSEIELRGPKTLERLRSELAGVGSTNITDPLPSGHGYFVMLSYDLFRHLEPTAISEQTPTDDRDWPDAILLRCEGGILQTDETTTFAVIHRSSRRWFLASSRDRKSDRFKATCRPRSISEALQA